MKKKLLAIVVLGTLAILIVALFGYIQISALQNQINTLEAQNREIQVQLSELQNQLNELQLQNREQQDRLNDFTYELAKARHLNIKISEFHWIGGFDPIGGLLIGHPVNITIQNNDVVPLSGLRLRVSLNRENTGAVIGIVDARATIERLNVGESRVIRGEPAASLSTSLNDAVYVVTLAVNDIVLDKGTFSIS